MSGTEEQKTVSVKEFHSLAQDVSDMKSLMSKMVEALNHISVINERQQTFTSLVQKLDERMERMENRQHQSDVTQAVAQASTSRLDLLDMGFRELHIDRERDKARFQTVVWMVRGLWAVAGVGGLIGLLRGIGGNA